MMEEIRHMSITSGYWFMPKIEADVAITWEKVVDEDGDAAISMSARIIEGTMIDRTNRSPLARLFLWAWKIYATVRGYGSS